MKRFPCLLLTLFLLNFLNGYTQTAPDWKEMFKEANSYFLYEEYNEALPIYQQLLREFPGNHNIRYRIGVCYLNTPGQKELSIEYLERAARNVSEKHRGENIKENNAPPESIFRLGDAYRVNNMLDKALDAYERFKKSVNEKDFNIELVDEQIRACENAKKLMQNPLFLDSRNMGETINSRFSDYNPVVSSDGNMMVFMRELQFYDAPFFSSKVDGKWTEPENITFQLGEDEDLYTSSISSDGRELYLYKIDDYDGNICVSTFDGQRWSRIQHLNENINTKYWESHASISSDGKALYFTSNRKGGFGDLDIYVSRRDSFGAPWGPAENLGQAINTPYNEDSPFITEDGKTLFFSSYGHFNIGGYDVFYSNLLEDSTWSAPLNMGYPVNTPDDNLFYYPVGEGYLAYYSIYDQGGYGEQDIFEFEVYSDEHPKKYLIRGLVSLNQVMGYTPDGIRVRFIDIATGDTVAMARAGDTGVFQTELTHGEYQVLFEADKFVTTTDKLVIDRYERADTFSLDVMMEEADLLAILELSDTSFNITRGNVRIDLVTEKNSTLVVETIRDSVVVEREEFEIRKTDYVYRIDPEPGETTLRFTLTDEFGNIAVKKAHISYEPPRPKLRPVPERVLRILEELKAISGGELRDILSNTDPLSAKLYSEQDLRKYLVEQSNNPAEVDTLFMYRNVVGGMNPSQVITKLSKYASGDLLDLVGTINPRAWTDSTSFDLIDHLIGISEGYDFTATDIRRALMVSPAAEKQKVSELKGRMEEIAEGKLKSSLEELEPDSEGISNNQELVEYLIGKAEIFGYDKEEVFRLITSLAAGGKEDVLVFFDALTNAADGALKNFLLGLDRITVSEMTPQELLEYILQESVNQPYTADQVWDLLFRLMEQHSEMADKVVQKLSEEKTPGHSWIFWLTGAGVLIIILFLLFRSRKRKKVN